MPDHHLQITIGNKMKHRAKNGGNDAYYTNPEIASGYVQTVRNLTGRRKFSNVIEPSAGNGAFLSPMVTVFGNAVGYDLYPTRADVIESDWFNVEVPLKSLVIGNPPFGFAASLAIRFFNHAATGADMIAFVVPRSFQKASVQRKLNLSFHLIHEELCPDNAFLIDGVAYDVPCVFQVWKRMNAKRKLDVSTKGNPFFEFTTKANADFCIRRVGGRAGQVLAGIDHTDQTTFFLRSLRSDAVEAVTKCFPAFAELRDMTAGVRSVSKSEINAVMVAFAAGSAS
jgi:hypothetical protein